MSIKKNFVYSSILTVSNYIFPMITFPYVSRVLGVTNVGVCSFVDSIIHYFILFSMMGVSATGIRAIAGSNKDKKEQGKIFSSLLTLNAITTFLMLLALLISIEIVPQFTENRKLLYIGAAKLVCNLFLVEWFFKGTECFKWITQRTIFIKILYVISILLFVKTPEDYDIYYILTVGIVCLNAAFNFPYACSKIKLSFRNLEIKKHLKSFFTMGVYIILTSMYTSFNIMYLGIVSSDTEVGYYYTSTKLFHIILAIYTAFTGVMLPRMSALFSENRIDEFKRMIKKSVTGLIIFAVPVVILTSLLAPEIVYTLSGAGYEGANTPAQIIMPLIFIIGYEQILILQILMPTKEDKHILRNSIMGATIGFALNLLLVQRLGATGSAIVWVASEITVLISAQIIVSKKFSLHFPFIATIKNIIFYIPSIVLIILLKRYGCGSNLYNLTLGSLIIFINAIFVLKYTQPQIMGTIIGKFNKRKN